MVTGWQNCNYLSGCGVKSGGHAVFRIVLKLILGLRFGVMVISNAVCTEAIVLEVDRGLDSNLFLFTTCCFLSSLFP